jgi:hypothetical protein
MRPVCLGWRRAGIHAADAAGCDNIPTITGSPPREKGMNRNETAQQYIARILAFSAGRDPRGVLASTAERLRALVTSTAPDRWRHKPAPDKWSAGAVLAHLADAEIVAGWRVRLILGQDGAPLQPFDQEVWANAFRYEQVDVHESLATFSAARASLLSLLSRVEPDRLTHHGMHAERGVETIAHLMRLYAGHDLNHLAQIERLVARPSDGGQEITEMFTGRSGDQGDDLLP